MEMKNFIAACELEFTRITGFGVAYEESAIVNPESDDGHIVADFSVFLPEVIRIKRIKLTRSSSGRRSPSYETCLAVIDAVLDTVFAPPGPMLPLSPNLNEFKAQIHASWVQRLRL